MNSSARFYVYVHRFRNGTLYVGKGTRNRAHQTASGRHNTHWDRLRAKYGAPRSRIISNKLAEQDALDLECIVIDRLLAKGCALCNQTLGGNGCRGMLVSDETRQRLSEASSGEQNSMFARTHSEEAKRRISDFNTGRFVGKKSGRYDPRVLDFVHEDGTTFTGTRWEFRNAYSLWHSQVSHLCSGRSRSVRGWRLQSTPADEAGKKGRRNGRYDHTVYHFRHDSGAEEKCTRQDLAIKYGLPNPANLSSLCNGKIPSYKGWRLIRSRT